MKKKVTLLIAGVLVVAAIAVGATAKSVIEEIKAELRPDFSIVVDGREETFKNAQGEVVYPVLYEGTTYLPVRAIGELMGKTVYWYEDDKRIELRETTVTDADVIVDSTENKKDKPEKIEKPEKTVKPEKTEKVKDKVKNEAVDKSQFIGEAAAEKIAFEKAGVLEDENAAVRTELEKDDGVWVYEVKIRKDGIEYEVKIHAVDGEILEWDKDFDD